ncbi:MAG: hypothetical protein ACNA8G_11325 [Gammaproteobacteria bacterium]
MTRIRFHIGAHKTASTHLQMTLAGCSFAPGTRYVPLKRLRMTLTSPVRKCRPRLPWHRWHGGSWLFSDENILGTTRGGLRMYPEPARALRYFLDCELSIFLCVRRYDTFLASAYGESLWRHPYRPFEAALPTRRWPDVIRDLQRDLPGVPVHVWRYEDYRENARSIMQFYAGDAITDFGAPLRQDPKSGFSGRAVEAMARFSDARPRKAEVLRLREGFPIGAEYPRFDPWSAEQRARLEAMYAEDLAVIDGIATLWTPAHSPKR